LKKNRYDLSNPVLYVVEFSSAYKERGLATSARSKTFPGIAEAMAKQWGKYLIRCTE